jgi:hypothetical protein
MLFASSGHLVKASCVPPANATLVRNERERKHPDLPWPLPIVEAASLIEPVRIHNAPA